MPNENENGAGAEGAAQPQTPAQPAPGPQFITREDFLAAQKLQAEQFAKILQDSIGTLKGEVLEAVVPGRAKPPAKPAPRPAATPAKPGQGQELQAPERPWETDPEYQAQRTELAELKARTTALQQQLEGESKARAAAEESSKQAAKERAIMRELTDLDNPHRTTDEYAVLATELLTRRGLVRYGAKDGKLYMTVQGEDGADKTVPLKDGVRSWLNTEEGRRLRPAPPSGGGTTSGGWGGAPAGEGGQQLTTAQQFAVALQKQQQMQGGGRGN